MRIVLTLDRIRALSPAIKAVEQLVLGTIDLFECLYFYTSLVERVKYSGRLSPDKVLGCLKAREVLFRIQQFDQIEEDDSLYSTIRQLDHDYIKSAERLQNPLFPFFDDIDLEIFKLLPFSRHEQFLKEAVILGARLGPFTPSTEYYEGLGPSDISSINWILSDYGNHLDHPRIEQLLSDYRSTIDDARRGYELTGWDWDLQLHCREDLDTLLQRVPAETFQKLTAIIVPMDRQLLEVTEAHSLTPLDKYFDGRGFWQYRWPKDGFPVDEDDLDMGKPPFGKN